MTALERYIRLEALGLWREGPGAEPREVVVSFGAATLVLTDLAENPLGHWALAGVQAVGRDGRATVYAMTPDGGETLTIRDRDMVEAIAAVSRAYADRPPTARPRRRRRRWPALILLLIVLALAAALLPALIAAQAARMVPPEAAGELGDRMLIAVIEARGAPCDAPEARRVLAQLAAAADPEAPPRVAMLDLGGRALALPGRRVLLDRDATAGVGSGAIQAAGRVSSALDADPVEALMLAAGPLAGLRYILTGRIGDAALARASLALAETSSGGIDDRLSGESALPSDAEWQAMFAACP